MRNIELAIVGDIAWNHDITPSGQKISPGGAAYYSSVGATRFSQNVGTVAKVGKDFDLSLLTRRKIDTEGVKVTEEGKTCRFVLTQHEDNTREFEAIRGVADTVETSIFPERYSDARYIHLPTQLPQHALIWLDFLKGHKGISVDSFEAFVKDWPDLTKEMFKRASMIFTNESEWETLSAFGAEFTKKPILIKRGKDGATYINEGKSTTIAAPSVDAIETTGAGDVLAGAFLAQRAKNIPVGLALKNAVGVASLSVTEFGVEHIPTKEIMEKKPDVVTAVLLVNSQGKILLAFSRKFADKLIIPGGHFKPGETPEECARREIQEETGINTQNLNFRFLRKHEIYSPDYKGTGRRFVAYNYCVNIGNARVDIAKDEYKSYMFVDPNEALKIAELHPSVRKIIKYYLEYINA